MLHRTLLLASLVLGSGCGDDGHEETKFNTFQPCFDEHFDFGRKLTPVESILECCLSHPINNMSPACGMTAPDCINFLTANLNQFSATTVEVMDACNTYADQL